MSERERTLDQLIFQRPDERLHDPAEYLHDKIIGRRTQSGVKRLKKLHPIHRRIVAMHCRGLTNRDIALYTGRNECHISNILRDPLSQQYIKAYIAGKDDEMEALADLAVDAVRSALLSQSEITRLKAADRFFRVTGRYTKAEDKKETAEDVIARALQAIENQSGALKNLTEKERPMADILDITPTRASEKPNGDCTSDHEAESRGTLVPMVRTSTKRNGG